MLELRAVIFTTKGQHCSPQCCSKSFGTCWERISDLMWSPSASCGPTSCHPAAVRDGWVENVIFNFTKIIQLIAMQLSREFWVHKNKNIKQHIKQFSCKSVELIPDSGTKMLQAALERSISGTSRICGSYFRNQLNSTLKEGQHDAAQ